VSEAPARRCEACGAELAERQRWCLVCGSAALTAVAATPRWRLSAAVAALLALLALVGVGYAVATLAQS
jgi:uncharacterized OB-fold protein